MEGNYIKNRGKGLENSSSWVKNSKIFRRGVFRPSILCTPPPWRGRGGGLSKYTIYIPVPIPILITYVYVYLATFEELKVI